LTFAAGGSFGESFPVAASKRYWLTMSPPRLVDVAVRRVGQDRMRVRRRLDDLLRRPDLAGLDRAHRHLVPAIGRAQQIAAAPVGRDIGHAVRQGGVAEMRQLAGLGVDREARDRQRLAAGADMEHALVGADRHRRRRPRLGQARDRHLLDLGQAAALRVEREDVNIVALGVADIDEGGGLRGGHGEGSGERGSAQEDGGTRCGTWHGLPPGSGWSANAPSRGTASLDFWCFCMTKVAARQGPPDAVSSPARR
jgi:hypothetical protein